MSKKIVWLTLSCLVVLSLALASCAPAAPEGTPPPITPPPTTTPPTTPPPTTTPPLTGTGKWFAKFGQPQYGDTITVRKQANINFWDPYLGTDNARVQSFYLETLAMGDWAVDRAEYSLKVRFIPPDRCQGNIAESWETPDMATYIFHIRKGIRWQNIPPANGREFTASDVEFSWHRMLGLGSGYTKPSPTYSMTQYQLIKSITATDKYTVVFKLSEPSYNTLRELLDNATAGNIVNREAVQQWGDLNDWKRAVGTGPFILKDYVASSSVSYVKNPDYYMYSEWYPQDKLPYADKIKLLVIPEISTALAAMRTGKIDLAEEVPWEQAVALAKTNPEMQEVTCPLNGYSISMRVANAPFTDIRVRKALQMAIDLKAIAATLYGGLVPPTPYGAIGPSITGYYTPFEKWPKEIQDEYTYNPQKAKQLLAEAGYPNGFKTNIVLPSNWDMDLAQIIKSYFKDVGVDMEIKVVDSTTYVSMTRALKHDQLADQYIGEIYPPLISIASRYTGHRSNLGGISDKVYDAMYDKANVSLDPEEQRKLMIEANDYLIAQHWTVSILPRVVYSIYQPWFKGYSGEAYLGGTHYARFWIDQTIKKSMTR